MATNLPSLVVSLEANMAKFSADMDKAAAKTDQSMLQMAASTLRVESAIKSLETQSQRGLQAAISLGKGMLLGAAVGMSFDAVKNKVLGVIDGMANLKTISEKTGASVENISKIQFFAKQSGSDIDAVAAAMAKMSKGMAGADNETKGAGLALNYLGLSAKDASGNLKDPAVMIMEVAKKLGEYKDGAGKAAIAQALFGKAGADMLPTLKLMAEQGDIEAKVTTAQAEAARQYQRDLNKLDAQKNMLFKTIAVALLPTMSDFTNVLLEASKNTNLVNGAVKGLAKDSSIEDWADNGAMALALVVDTIKLMPSLFSTATSGIKSVSAAAKVGVMSLPGTMIVTKVAGGKPLDNLAAAKKEFDDAQMEYGEKIYKLLNSEVDATRKAMQEKIDIRKKARENGSESASPAKGGTKDLNYNTKGEDGSAQRDADKAAQEAARLAKNVNAGRIKDLEEGQAREQSAMDAANALMAEARSQDLISVDQYNTFRKESMDSALKAQITTYDKEIAESQRYLATLAKGSDREAEQTKIDTLKARRQQALDDGQQKSTLYTLEQNRAQSDLNKTMKDFVIQQDDAAKDFQFQIDMYGRSTLEVNKLTAARRIQLQVDEQVRRAQKDAGTDIPIDRSGYDAAAADAIAKSNALFDKQDAQMRDPWRNAAESLRRYGDEASNTGALLGTALSDSFRTSEDALVQFITTGKLGFKDLVSSVLTNFARLEAKKGLSALLSLGADALSSYFGSNNSITSRGASVGDYNLSAGGADTSTSFLDSIAGHRATGGSVLGGSSYLVGERGPEIFNPAGAGTIIPNSQIGGGGGVTINMETNISAGSSSTTTSGASDADTRAATQALNSRMKAVVAQETQQGGSIWKIMKGRG